MTSFCHFKFKRSGHFIDIYWSWTLFCPSFWQIFVFDLVITDIYSYGQWTITLTFTDIDSYWQWTMTLTFTDIDNYWQWTFICHSFDLDCNISLPSLGLDLDNNFLLSFLPWLPYPYLFDFDILLILTLKCILFWLWHKLDFALTLTFIRFL